MSGVKGQHGPHFLKCSSCKKWRDGPMGRPSKGDLVRTGKVKPVRLRSGCGYRDATAQQLECLDCGHVGWYTHQHAAAKPLRKVKQ